MTLDLVVSDVDRDEDKDDDDDDDDDGDGDKREPPVGWLKPGSKQMRWKNLEMIQELKTLLTLFISKY